MGYALYILRRAQKELAQLPTGAYERVRDTIRALAQDPRPPGCLKLKGREGLSGLQKYRLPALACQKFVFYGREVRYDQQTSIGVN